MYFWKNFRMNNFWYHSPVRFYRTIEQHQNAINHQNISYFGSENPYPLEIGVWHRFLIPMVDNYLPDGQYRLYVVNKHQKKHIESAIFIEDNKIKHISFYSKKPIEGQLVLLNRKNEAVFYSNCVRFLDSSDYYGRKYIRIATRNSYNKNLFDFESEGAWIVTNLPAYDLGINSVEVEVSNNRTAGNSTLRVKDSYVDEMVKYQFLTEGDFNALNFINAHAVNDYFFIDGTQRTCIEKMEQDDFAMSGIMKFANVKDENGINISLNEEEIWKNMKTGAFSSAFSGGFD